MLVFYSLSVVLWAAYFVFFASVRTWALRNRAQPISTPASDQISHSAQ
jgi:hypothetical protein